MKIWTIDDVKKELPDFTAKINGESVPMRSCNRHGKFATGYNPHTCQVIEVTWSTLADCLTKNKPVLC